jgi:ATP adenylyltransferase
MKVRSGTLKKNTSHTSGEIRWDEQIWPMERDVLFRPDRYKYVRKLIKPKGCVFCESAKKPLSLDTLCLYRSKLSMIVLNKYPYNTGHLLVIPRKHGGEFLKLSPAAYTDLHKTLKIAVQAVQKTYQPDGYNVGMNQGSVSGAGIPDHLHMHVIPRWAGDLNFMPLIAETKVVIESLPETYDRFMRYFNKK